MQQQLQFMLDTETINQPPFVITDRLMALSWKQPYAELMLHGKVETRKWATKYRGWVLICVSKQAYTTEKLRIISGTHQLLRMGDFLAKENPNYEGNAIAIGQLINCYQMLPEHEDKTFVSYSPGLWCHEYSQVQTIKPFAWKGTQGWKEVTMDIKQNIEWI